MKIANSDLLNDNSEDHIAAFGQVVPIVMVLLVILALWDLFIPKERFDEQQKKCQSETGPILERVPALQQAKTI
jgi:hypothetical protein